MTRIAVLLNTKDRADLTAITLASFAQHHRTSDFVLLHADDASADDTNCGLAREHGWSTVVRNTRQQGHMASYRALVQEALADGCDWALKLENDWEWERPTPAWAYEAMGQGDWPEVDCIRLYGDAKAKEGPRAPTGPHLMGTKTPIGWRWVAPGVEYALKCHYAGPPSYARLDALVEHIADAPTMKALGLAWQPATLRATDNCVWHIGLDGRTPGHMV